MTVMSNSLVCALLPNRSPRRVSVSQAGRGRARSAELVRDYARNKGRLDPPTSGVVRVMSGRVALRAFDRGRGARCATGRNPCDNFADDQRRCGASSRTTGPVRTVGLDSITIFGRDEVSMILGRH